MSNILVHSKTTGSKVKADYINPCEWFQKTWLIGFGQGFDTLFVVVEADNEQEALDALVDDGKYNHLILADDDEELDPDFTSYAGNEVKALDPNLDIRVFERVYPFKEA